MLYTEYEPEDFLADESFLAWQRKTDPIAQAFWEKWLAQHPTRQPVVDQAIKLLTCWIPNG